MGHCRTLERLSLQLTVILAVYQQLLCGADDVRTHMLHLLQAIKRPDQPEQFRSMNELNQYLGELKQYYNVIGRPRLVSVNKLQV